MAWQKRNLPELPGWEIVKPNFVPQWGKTQSSATAVGNGKTHFTPFVAIFLSPVSRQLLQSDLASFERLGVTQIKLFPNWGKGEN